MWRRYRRISVLPVFSKIFKKVTYKQQYEYLENNSILHEQKYGFRSKSTTILHLLQYLYKQTDSGNVVFSLFLNFWNLFLLPRDYVIKVEYLWYSRNNFALVPLISIKYREQYIEKYRKQYIIIIIIISILIIITIISIICSMGYFYAIW